MGIDLEGGTGSCEFYFHWSPRPWRTKGGLRTLSGPARADALTEMLTQSRKKVYTHPGLEMSSVLLKVIELIVNPLEFRPPAVQAASAGLGKQRPALCPAPPLTVCPGSPLLFEQQVLYP